MGHIFISYSHKDSDYVHKLKDALDQEGFDPWIDDHIDYGDEWLKVIQKHLDECDAFIIVMSRNSFESEMVQNEVTRAREKKKAIFPLLLDGDNWLIFQARQYVDVQNGLLPTEKFYRRLAAVTLRNKKEKVVSPPPPLPPAKDPSSTRKEVFYKASPFLKITGFAGFAIVLLWGGFLIIPKFASLLPAARATETFAPQQPTAGIVFTKTPAPPSTTPEPQATSTKTQTPAPSVTLSSEIRDAKGVPMRLVLAGDFTMGFLADEAYNYCQTIITHITWYGSPCRTEDYLREEPVHQVYLNSFFIDVYEVSNEEYKKCVTELGCTPPSSKSANRHSSYYDNENFSNYPVLNVNWDMAKKYCEWRGARLPTEAEWEKAARGTDGRPYPWGIFSAAYDLYDPAFYVNRANVNLQSFNKATQPVDSNPKGLSPYGLYNMAGNVAEWVADWYSKDYYAVSPRENPPGPSSGEFKVIRGGSVNTYEIRTTARDFQRPIEPAIATGFRCAKDVAP